MTRLSRIERLLGDHLDLACTAWRPSLLGEVGREPPAVAVERVAEHRSVSRSANGATQLALRASSDAKESGGSIRGATRRRKSRTWCSAMKASVGA